MAAAVVLELVQEAKVPEAPPELVGWVQEAKVPAGQREPAAKVPAEQQEPVAWARAALRP